MNHDNLIVPPPLPRYVTDPWDCFRQRDKLEDYLRGLHPEREQISEAMMWCVEHADSAEEVVECIAESLGIAETPLNKKVFSSEAWSKYPSGSTIRKVLTNTYRISSGDNLVKRFALYTRGYTCNGDILSLSWIGIGTNIILVLEYLLMRFFGVLRGFAKCGHYTIYSEPLGGLIFERAIPVHAALQYSSCFLE